MKLVLKILFLIFLVMLVIGFYLKNREYVKADLIIGLDVLFMAFVLMPLFIFYRYRQGKYKKYAIDPKSKNPFKIDKDKMI
ncbi:MAG: hypothetical protein KDC69_09055 [Flavobacteriaceae bacterium]|nr:hypothetical protein [Flavobacteriaceae bacterium]